MTPPVGRRMYLDVLRGLAVLVMIEAHVIDSWTGAADRASAGFGWSLILGGFGAPLFLFLAGMTVALSAASKARKLGDDRAAASVVQRRGVEIFLLAFLFRLQAFVLSGSPAYTLLKVDILNIMGPAIVATALLWGLASSARVRLVVFAMTTAAIAFATPIVRAFGWLALLPDPLEGYIRPVPGLTNFSIFPWAAFVPAGAVAGVLIDCARTAAQERRLNWRFAIAGASLAMAAYAASFLPTPYARSDFWTSSPSFFFLRTGLMTFVIALAYAWEQRPGAARKWSGLRLLGQTSLFIYWIHVEMVYGLISTPLHRSMTLAQAWGALALFCLFMLLLATLKVRVANWWRGAGWAVAIRGHSAPGAQKQA
ncbi:MAG: hypothetical protein DMF84_09885 [Acidobacteria bacterium]|nr:MAG: hypothetical protein DMF84_09885 [Acidobacteriota bacterium]